MANVARGGANVATFKASATLTTLYEPVYISASGTVAAVNTVTNVAIGTVEQKSKAGAGSSVDINLFQPTRMALAGGTVTAGGKVTFSTGTSRIIDAVTNGAAPIGIAVVGASTASETVEYIPSIAPFPTIT
jgi:hypothetical protein